VDIFQYRPLGICWISRDLVYNIQYLWKLSLVEKCPLAIFIFYVVTFWLKFEIWNKNSAQLKKITNFHVEQSNINLLQKKISFIFNEFNFWRILTINPLRYGI
jgi:hypothetical protein